MFFGRIKTLVAMATYNFFYRHIIMEKGKMTISAVPSGIFEF